MLRSRQAQIFAQDFEQRLVRRESDFRRLAVQDELDVRLLFVRIRHNLTGMILAKEGVKPQVCEAANPSW